MWFLLSVFFTSKLAGVWRWLAAYSAANKEMELTFCGCGLSVKAVWVRQRLYWQRRFICSCVEWSQIAWPRGHRPARRRRRCRHRRRNRPMKLFHWKIRRRAPYHWSQPCRFVASSILTRGCLPSIFITVKYWHLSLMYLRDGTDLLQRFQLFSICYSFPECFRNSPLFCLLRALLLSWPEVLDVFIITITRSRYQQIYNRIMWFSGYLFRS